MFWARGKIMLAPQVAIQTQNDRELASHAGKIAHFTNNVKKHGKTISRVDFHKPCAFSIKLDLIKKVQGFKQPLKNEQVTLYVTWF